MFQAPVLCGIISVIQNSLRLCGGISKARGFIMLLSLFNGWKYGYSYETETGNYMLYDNDYKSHIYLQGRDARIFREEIERIKNLPDPEYKTRLLTENAIKFYL
jgi:hypothetical protein